MMAVGMMEKNMTDNCIEWTKSKDRDGYGLHWNGTKMVRAHRVAYEEYYGSFDSELSVCHICDNPSCVNPKHLFLGTQQDNMNDRKQKNRYSSYHSKHKINHIIANDIRKREHRAKYYAKKYNISPDTVYGIWQNRNWR